MLYHISSDINIGLKKFKPRIPKNKKETEIRDEWRRRLDWHSFMISGQILLSLLFLKGFALICGGSLTFFVFSPRFYTA
jgi:hypothetical protein